MGLMDSEIITIAFIQRNNKFRKPYSLFLWATTVYISHP